jgi:Alcohol dehydrogenase transcription factor Myb/SANT-like
MPKSQKKATVDEKAKDDKEAKESELIEAVRAEKTLYDQGDPLFMDTTYKQRLWGEIAVKLGYKGIIYGFFFLHTR